MARSGYTCPLCHQPVTSAQYQKIMSLLRRKKELSKKEMQERIEKVERLARRRADERAEKRLDAFKKRLRESARKQLRLDKANAVLQAEKKYGRANRTLQSILKSKELQIHGQEARIIDLEKQLKKQTTPQIEGLLYEKNLIRALRKQFPQDRFEHKGKGGDILQSVIRDGQHAGLIVYECKRVRDYKKSYAKQAFEALRKRKADFAIVVTNAMKKGTQGFFVERGVMIVHATGVLSLAGVVRGYVIQIAQMKLGQLQRKKAVKLVFDYLEGPEFASSIDTIIQESLSLYKDLTDEMKRHISTWRKRYGSYKKMHDEAFTVKTTSKSLLSGEAEPKRLIETLPALMKLPEVRSK